jgi:hypothetical protein
VSNSSTVAQFVIERELPGAGTLSDLQIREISLRSLQALSAMGPQIRWLHSYVTEDKVYCVYLAPDEDSIREHARRAGMPADRVSAVRRLIDPAALGEPHPAHRANIALLFPGSIAAPFAQASRWRHGHDPNSHSNLFICCIAIAVTALP